MSTFYVSDLHFGHKLVAKHRGFGEHADSTKNHDDDIIKVWHSQVKNDDDIVWVLGDLAVSSPKRALDIMSRLPGRKLFIAGNHDECHPLHRRAFKKTDQYLAVFEWVSPFARRKVDGVEFLLSHFPYAADHTETARYNEVRLRDEGFNLVHGHTHSTAKVTSKRELHVGWDAWRMLVPEEMIVEHFKGGSPS